MKSITNASAASRQGGEFGVTPSELEGQDWERSHEKFKRGGRAHKTLQIPSLHMQLNERKRVREMEREARMGGGRINSTSSVGGMSRTCHCHLR